MKKKLLYLFSCFLLLTLILNSLPVSVYADQDQPGDRRINFDARGNLIIQIVSTAATSGIKYRTIGWVIHTEPMCKNYSGVYDCRPTETVHVEFLNENSGDHQMIPNPPIPGEPVKSIWTFPSDTVNREFYQKFQELYNQNEITALYFSAIMESYDGATGQRRKGPFYTLNGIKNAEPWAHPEDLNAYFDLRVTYNPLMPITEVLYLIDQNNNRVEVRRTDVGEYQLYEHVQHIFDDTYFLPDGTRAEIVRSYLSPMLDPSLVTFEQRVDRGDPKVLVRDFTPHIGGTLVVAEYKIIDDSIPETGVCTPQILPPNNAQSLTGEDLNPNAHGVIKADSRGNEMFDVLLGIPTSETLYANAFGKNYLYKNKFQQKTGKVTYTVPVIKTYIQTWTEMIPSCSPDGCVSIPVPRQKTTTVKKDMTVEREYFYWVIENLEVYSIDKATMTNYALPGGTVTLTPNGYTPPSFSANHSDVVTDHVFPADCGMVNLGTQVVPGGNAPEPIPDETSLFQSAAEERVGQNKVKNDYLIFNGQTIMSDSQVERSAPTPGSIPSPTEIHQDVLYRNNLLISSSLLNRANTPSTGKIYYKLIPGNINGGSNKEFDIPGINTVTVHTPTVNYSDASDDAEHNQKTKPNYSRRAFILDRPFTVTIPTSGQHRNIPGYGNRDYAKYIKLKQVRFEFDVYSGDKSKFYPANTWIDIPVNQIVTTFYLPVWVDEGNYTVYFRSFAENAPSSGFTTQQDANLDLTHHVATDTVPVEVIGRIYDFRITDIADPNWETVFRTAQGSSTSKGMSYWVGPRGIDGAPNGSVSPYHLPIRTGSHPLSNYKNVSVKTGYHFKFDLKTKGNMFGDLDAIRITPTFYYQDADPSTPPERIEVDLYYHSDTKKFIKIGSPEDTERREIILNSRLRNVPYSDLVNTAGSIYDLNTGWTMTRDQYIKAFLKRASEPTYVGGYDVQILTSPLRTFINTFDRPSGASATPARVNASIQQWYGEYSLPAQVYAVPKGTDLAAYARTHGGLDEKSPIFLKNGFITVNFNIETIRNGDLANPHLQYIHGPLNNQWWNMEGFDGTDGRRDHVITDPYGVQFLLQDGDVIFYHTDLSSYDDFSPRGTH